MTTYLVSTTITYVQIQFHSKVSDFIIIHFYILLFLLLPFCILFFASIYSVTLTTLYQLLNINLQQDRRDYSQFSHP